MHGQAYLYQHFKGCKLGEGVMHKHAVSSFQVLTLLRHYSTNGTKEIDAAFFLY